MSVIIFSICPNTSLEQVPDGFTHFLLQQHGIVPFFGEGSSAKPFQKLPSPPPMEHVGPVQLSINSAGGHSLCAGWLQVSEQVHALMSCPSSP